MKNYSHSIFLGLILTGVSAMLYGVHYLIFHDAHHIFMFLVSDIAFIPFEVLLATLILHRILEQREKKHILEKLNMVIGTFFSETGTGLLKRFLACDAHRSEICSRFVMKTDCENTLFEHLQNDLKKQKFEITASDESLAELKEYLSTHRNFLLKLLENPVMLEHEVFTELLRAVFHVEEELYHRELKSVSENDRKHLENDIKRAYVLLIEQWILYMKYLKVNYPYLFSFAVRTNPFDPVMKIEIS